MRNKLLIRIAAGVLMIAIFLACLLHEYAFMAGMAFVIIVMHVEYYDMAVGKGAYRAEKILATAASLALFATVFAWKIWQFDARWLFAAFVPLFLTCGALVFDKAERGDNRKTENILFPIIYIGLSAALSGLLLFDGSGAFSGRLFLSVFILIWSSDIGAYVLGMGFGQKPDSRKLCPGISPHKSWIGVWGGLLFVCLAAVVLKLAGWLAFGWGHVAALSVLVLVCGLLGDLFESLVKRHYGVKDSGRIMPGHGGLLDRFDSALAVLPVVAVYLKLFGII